MPNASTRSLIVMDLKDRVAVIVTSLLAKPRYFQDVKSMMNFFCYARSSLDAESTREKTKEERVFLPRSGLDPRVSSTRRRPERRSSFQSSQALKTRTRLAKKASRLHFSYLRSIDPFSSQDPFS